MKRNPAAGLVLDSARESLISSTGGVLLQQTVRLSQLDRTLSTALAPWRSERALHDPGKVLLDLAVEVGADPGDLELADTARANQRLDQVVDLPGRDPVQIGLHDHREQRLVDPPPALEQAGEERPGPQLRDPQLQIPAVVVKVRGRDPLRCVVR